MNINELGGYIERVKVLKDILANDMVDFVNTNFQVLNALKIEHDKLLSLLTYVAIFDGGKLKFPRNYFELQEGNAYDIDFNMDEAWFIITVQRREEESENESD